MRTVIALRSALLSLLIAVCAPSVFAQLNAGQARNIIRHVAGSNLPSNAVRVKKISAAAAGAEVSAEIETVFRFEQASSGEWTIREIRVAPDRWEDLSLFASAVANADPAPTNAPPLTPLSPPSGCTSPEFVIRHSSALTVKRARCLLAGLLSVKLPSDAVRIRQISGLGLPFASNGSTLVVANMLVDFRITQQASKAWQVTGLRTGDRDWIDLNQVESSLAVAKQRAAASQIQLVAAALDQFQKERGTYVISEQYRVLIDYLTPRYLSRIVRVDPWHQPYQYRGTRDTFVISSSGPDGKSNTPDDIAVLKPR
jgi:hypothetical protein